MQLNSTTPYQRRSSYEMAAEFDNHFGNRGTILPSCRVHGSRNNNFPPLPHNEDLVYISERDITPPPNVLLTHTNSLGNLGNVQNSQTNSGPIRRIHFCPEFIRAMENVHYIADCTRRTEEENEVMIDFTVHTIRDFAVLLNVTKMKVIEIVFCLLNVSPILVFILHIKCFEVYASNNLVENTSNLYYLEIF
jgi:hypothetical protein